ncbi:alpha-(1-_3)-arabinofuranosyltransferase family protein [Nocardia sp. NPDC088792]|uniref:alpha-(1->3)-arabinofuranosyltransferase domain-containing protein n=1 Tax=Nocardia sp. NPDC088792 TaxID=3364332 RepID=UPI00381F37E7
MTSSFPAAGPSEDRSPDTAPLGRRWLLGTVIAAFLLTFLQAPGFTVADTKYDLAQNPLGFLARASHLWSSQAPMGQVQNQAYGYFFPHGAFFSLGHVLGLPGWVTQRIWWALLLLAGFWGIIRLCEILGIGSRGSRIIAALAFALSPRVLTTLGSISSETAPMMLAPWVLLAPAALGVVMHRRGADAASEVATADADLTSAAAVPPARAGLRGLSAMWPRHGFGGGNRTRATTSGSRRVWLGAATPAGSALALALMGSVNAVATAAAFLPAALWWISFRPNRAWWRFTRAWIPLLALGTCWWVLPLLLLGKVSPPFLDFIESSGVTTQWASLGEVLRGTDSWTPFVSPERIAGAVLVTQPAAVLATGMLAAAGMAGLAMRSMPARGRLTLILCVGLVGICAGYAGDLGGPFAESVRTFLDSGGAPLRNVHKLEPLIRLPLVLGLAQLLSRVPLPASVPMRVWRSAFAHPERNRMVAVAGLILTALALSTSLAWTGKLAPRGAYDEVPGYWHQTADWLAHNAADTRALVVPGAPFGTQTWGLTRDEPLQALASTPWAVRDSVPLVPPGAIRAMDSVQRLIADGRPSASLAPTLAGQGIGILVLRNDLDPETSRSTRPLLAHEAIEGSPGIRKVAQFGDPIETGQVQGLVADEDLRPAYPAVEIYRVETGAHTDGSAAGAHTDGSAAGAHTDGSAAGAHTDGSAAGAAALADSGGVGLPADIRSGTGAPGSFPGAFTAPLDGVPVVQGGPEVVERLRRDPSTPPGPILLDSDAKQAGLPVNTVTITDTPMDREADFGRVDNHNSALRAPGDPRRTHNLVPDYPVPGAKSVEGEWSGATVTVSSAAGDATQLGGAAPGSSSAAAVDGDPSTAWISNGAEHAVGQWLRLDLQQPVSSAVLRLTTSAAAIGSPVKWVEVATAKGTVSARITAPGEPVAISLPPGNTSWIKVTAAHTEDGSGGGQFGISELSVDDYANRDNPVTIDIRHRTVLPLAPAGAQVRGWDLGQEFPGRSACFDAPDRVRCSKGLALAAEEPGLFERTLDVPQPLGVTPGLTVHTRPGPALEALLTDPDRPVARGRADVADPRGSAFAATDGDPRTAWIAPETTVRNPTGAKPTLTIELPAPTLVTGLEVTPAQGDLPAHPTSVAVNLGDGPQVRDVDPKSGAPTRIDLHPRVTDRIELSIQTWDSVLDQTALGFAQEQPPGLADVNVLGPDYPAPAPADRLLTVDCAHGPTIAAAGRTLHTTITATAAQLISGAPLPARVCDTGDATTPPGITTFDLPTGKIDVTVAPGDLFTVDDLRLDRTPAAGQPAADRTADLREHKQQPADQPSPGQPATGQSDPAAQGGSAGQEDPGVPGGAQPAATDPAQANKTEPAIGAPAGTRLLVLPLSTNVGWEAKTAGGQALEPVVINGWQQAWLLPPGTQGPITVSFPVDRWYRVSIFGGLLLLIPLLVFAVRAARAPVREDGPAPRAWRSRTVAAIGLTAAAGLIAGPTGIVLAALGVVAYWYRPPTWPRVLVWIAFAGTAISAAALSTGPWRSPDGYLGGSLWVQFPALVAVVAVGLAALPDQRGQALPDQREQPSRTAESAER